MNTNGDAWLDDDPGPVVRPYTVTGGRTQPAGQGFDLIAYVLTVEPSPPPRPWLHPEHVAVLGLCRRPLSVAEVAARSGLPLGVARVLISDLLQAALVSVREPTTRTAHPDKHLLEQVLHGLKGL